MEPVVCDPAKNNQEIADSSDVHNESERDAGYRHQDMDFLLRSARTSMATLDEAQNPYHDLDWVNRRAAPDEFIEPGSLLCAPAQVAISTQEERFWERLLNDNHRIVVDREVRCAFEKDRDDVHPSSPIRELSHVSSKHRKRRKHWLLGHISGWHAGVLASAGAASTVLLLNVIFMIVVLARTDHKEGIGNLYEGSCATVSNLTTALHVLINVLSSTLFSASNYTMQVLSAPRRQDIDQAHKKGQWLDIGVTSMRNLFSVRKYCLVLWIILVTTSVPIHIFYNSVVFKVIDANSHGTLVVNPRWVMTDVQAIEEESWIRTMHVLFADKHDDPRFVARLSNRQCIETYNTDYLSGWSHVLAITNENGITGNETVFFAKYSFAGLEGLNNSDWLFRDYPPDIEPSRSTSLDPPDIVPNRTTLLNDPNAWTINNKGIDHCLASKVPQHCQLQYSVQILLVVIIANSIKAITMIATFFMQRSYTLVTIGDAIASFLDKPDESTENRCLMSRSDVKGWDVRLDEQPQQMLFHLWGRKRRWFTVVSCRSWVTSVVLFVLTILLSSFYYNVAAKPTSQAFGSIDSKAVLNTILPSRGGVGLVSTVLLVNCPQAIASFLYLFYNNLMTSFWLAKEWSSYALRRKPLRVSEPYGLQRSTYHLSWPFRYSVPFVAIFATLHWVISQSIFLVRITVYENGEPVDPAHFPDTSSIGYSWSAVLTAILMGVALVLFALAMGSRRVHSAMPVVGSCSAAIAAACHRPADDIDAAYLPVQWGEVSTERKDDVGHCCFTAQCVEPVTPERMYAGINSPSAVFASGQTRRA